jgi:hypothetical protein
MNTNYQYCVKVPFTGEDYCYPTIVMQPIDMLALGLALLFIGISITLYIRGKAK